VACLSGHYRPPIGGECRHTSGDVAIRTQGEHAVHTPLQGKRATKIVQFFTSAEFLFRIAFNSAWQTYGYLRYTVLAILTTKASITAWHVPTISNLQASGIFSRSHSRATLQPVQHTLYPKGLRRTYSMVECHRCSHSACRYTQCRRFSSPRSLYTPQLQPQV
jgi:hypothetical protein